VTDPTAAIRDGLAETLSGRYALERELARGGMATVYLARSIGDSQLAAIKVMHPALAAELGHERFLREIAIAASMAHPLIVPLAESGAADGVLYYVMPYVEGETLHDRLQREKQLPLGDALRIARDVAAALGYAHARGVLHRDVKPENILLAGERALVADFGLARAIGAADYTKLTKTGVIVGTIYYMSPEQVREDLDLDQQARLARSVGAQHHRECAPEQFQVDAVERVHLVRRPWVKDVRDGLEPKGDLRHGWARLPVGAGGGISAPAPGPRARPGRTARSPA